MDLTEHLPYIHADRRWMPLKADTITKDYVKDAGVFADIFNYYIYGAENQAEIHYAMAVKNNLYDALEYAGQQM